MARQLLLCVAAFVAVAYAGVIINKEPQLSKFGWLQAFKKLAVNPETKDTTCFFCTLIIDATQGLLRQNETDEEIFEFVVKLCNGLNIEQPHVCDHIVYAFGEEILFVLEHALFTPDEICGAFITDCGVSENPLAEMWPIDIPANKPTVQEWPKVPEGKPTLKVLHLSDIHIDRQYAEGSEAGCQQDSLLHTYALCCRDYPPTMKDRETKGVDVPSGKWGMPYNCDLPYRTFENALKYISSNFKFDYIVVTGDKEAHDMWDYTRDLTIANIENITAALLQYFPDTKIYESIGNHEGVPMDAMAPHDMPEYEKRGPAWLYKELSHAWSNWLPETVANDVEYRASYAVYPVPGLKLISINTVYCSEFNFYLYIDQVDPDNTLQWLIEELLDSEAKGEKVHLISHIPPGASYCLKGWAHNFYDIVARFENTIAAQYYGHTHQDHFQVYYENSDPKGRPFQVNYIAPSLTTFAWNNPAFRIYTIDGNYEGSTFTTIDVETYATDLEEANANNHEPTWTLEYNLRKDFGMPDLSPASFHDLISRLRADDALFSKFVRFYYRSDYGKNCDAACKKKFICGLRTAKSYEEDTFCADL